MAAPPSESRLQALRAVVFDCDGVLTPGDLFYDEAGRRLLRFNARDGFGMALLCRHVQVGILSGRPTDIAERRFRELGVSHFTAQCRDKAAGLQAMCAAMQVEPQQCAFVGDDLPDLPAYAVAGLAVAVGDAAPELRQHADWVTHAHGGQGAAREVAETILKARGDWQRWIAKIPKLAGDREAAPP